MALIISILGKILIGLSGTMGLLRPGAGGGYEPQQVRVQSPFRLDSWLRHSPVPEAVCRKVQTP